MKKQNFTNHAFSGYDAYQQYDLCYSFNKEKAYLIWNERNNQQITNGTFNWNGIFENRPYIEKKLYPDGKAAYQMPILTNWQHETKTALKLPDYIDLSQQPAGMFDTVNKYIPTFQQQAETALQELEAFDRKAELIIKVVYYETEQAILNTGNYSENERTALVDQLHNRKKLPPALSGRCKAAFLFMRYDYFKVGA